MRETRPGLVLIAFSYPVCGPQGYCRQRRNLW